MKTFTFLHVAIASEIATACMREEPDQESLSNENGGDDAASISGSINYDHRSFKRGLDASSASSDSEYRPEHGAKYKDDDSDYQSESSDDSNQVIVTRPTRTREVRPPSRYGMVDLRDVGSGYVAQAAAAIHFLTTKIIDADEESQDADSNYHSNHFIEPTAFLTAHVINSNLPKEPKTLKEAMSSPHQKEWAGSIAGEVGSLITNGTWIEAELPQGRKALDTGLVFKLKIDFNTGLIAKFKSRLVVKGYLQLAGLDYTDTAAPTLASTTLRVSCYTRL
jgi:hypothetical protein